MQPSREQGELVGEEAGLGVKEEIIESPQAEVRFVDATEEVGIDFVHTSGRSGRKYGVETIGSGAAFFDYDRDGWMDLYVVNGGDLPGFVSKEIPQNALYRNEGGTFVEVGEEQGVADEGYGMGVTTGGRKDRQIA